MTFIRRILQNSRNLLGLNELKILSILQYAIRSQKQYINKILPVQRQRHHCVDTGKHKCHLANFTKNAHERTERPQWIRINDRVKGDTKNQKEQIRNGQVEYETVRGVQALLTFFAGFRQHHKHKCIPDHSQHKNERKHDGNNDTGHVHLQFCF